MELSSERLGGAVLAANDEFFAPKENLVKIGKPVFREGEYTDRGKWMDGWETRRRREPGHDWCLIRLGLPGALGGFLVDTTHFKGNYPDACSIEGSEAAATAGAEELQSGAVAWTELLPKTSLRGDAENLFAAATGKTGRFTHLRFHIFPDGGVARFRAYGTVTPDWDRLLRAGGEVDLASIENGGLVVSSSDMFFGSRHNLILPGPGRDMSDGWETKRRRGAGHDWAIVRLGTEGRIRRVELDTAHFKGNAPGSCSIEVVRAPDAKEGALTGAGLAWNELLPRTNLQPHTLHRFEGKLLEGGVVTHARLNIFPDGGVSRLRLFGTVAGHPTGQS